MVEISRCLVDTDQQFPVSVQRPGLCAGALLQVDYIGGVFGKCLAVVQGVALLNTALKVRGCPLDGLLNLAFRHAGGGFVSRSVADTLSRAIKAAGNADAVSRTGFVGDFLNRGHFALLSRNNSFPNCAFIQFVI